MKKVDNQKREHRGGRRPGAGRPRVPKITVVLTPDVLTQLVSLAEQQRRTPEEYAADLLTQAVTPLNQPSQEMTTTLVPLCELLPGPVGAVQPHQLKLIEQLQMGSRLVEMGRDIWMLTVGAESHRIDSRTIFAMRQKNMLVDAEKQIQFI